MICRWPNSLSQHPTSLLLVFQTHLWLTALHILARWLWHARSTFQPPLLHYTRKPVLSVEDTGLWSEFQLCSMFFNKSLQNTVHWTHPSIAHTSGSCSHRGQDKRRIFYPYYMYLEMWDTDNPRSSSKSCGRTRNQTQTSSCTTETTLSQNAQSRIFLPYYQVLTDTSACLCNGGG